MYKIFYSSILGLSVTLRIVSRLFGVTPCRKYVTKALEKLHKVVDTDKLLNSHHDVVQYYTHTTLRDYVWLSRITGYQGMHNAAEISMVDRVARYVDDGQALFA